jgi:Ca2+-binding EF-hand superfamily protein
VAGPYDVVLLAKSRPVVVRLDIRVDRKPLHVIWDEFIDYLFKYADVDGDGVLSRQEAESAPDPNSLRGYAALVGGFGGGGGFSFSQMDRNGDGKVTRQEFADYFRANLPPFQLNVGTPTNGMGRFNRFAKAEPSTADLNKALFRLLDANKDGKLSRAELAAAPAVFRKIDLDEDEIITHRELVPDFTPLSGLFGAVYSSNSGKNQAPEQPVVFLASSMKSPREIARTLLTRYGGPTGKKALSREEFALDPAAFARLDRDGNGKLDAEELARYPLTTPDVNVVLRLGERGEKEPAVEVVGKAPSGGMTVRAAQDTLVLLFGKERLAVRLGASKSRSQLGAFIRQIATSQFQAADRDNNGYIDEKEAMQSNFGPLFKKLDRNGTGKVYEKDFLAYLDTVEEQQARATGSTVTLQFADGGHSLMDLFDSDRDGKLSLREIQAMPRVLDELALAKGELGEADIPHSYLFKLDQGSSGGGLDPFSALETLGVDQGPPPPTGKGPLWFQKMDKNRDGDVSRAEFLGSDELFRRIDTNGDGLISVAEAERYEASLKKKTGQKP